jgi:large subunit ribosomal protein L36e
VIRDVVGLMPYEKRILDVIKTGGSGAEKKVRLGGAWWKEGGL